MIRLPLVSSLADDPQTSPERTVNWYGEKSGADQFTLRKTAGLKLFGAMVGSGGTRGLLRFKGSAEKLFGVRGNTFQEWDTLTSTFISRGILTSVVGSVGMTFNQTTAGQKQILIVDGTKAYKFDADVPASFAEVTPFLGGNSAAAYMSLRAFSITPNTGKVFCSNFDDLFTWNSIASIVAETFPDPVVALANVGPLMIVLGTDSMEAWADQGLPTFPLRRVQAGAKVGCSSAASVAVHGKSAYWLGGSPEGRGIVYRTNGYDPERISDDDVERVIAGMASFDDAVGYVVQEQGHVFYVLNFGVGDRTLVYDIMTGLWAEWEYRNSDGSVSRHPAVAQAVYLGKNLVGDARNGNVYEMSKQYLDNDGLPIVSEKIFTVWPSDTFELTNIPPFFIGLDVGLTPSGANEPQAMLSLSDDRGKTFGSEIFRGLGLTGQYDRRVVWDRMGSSFGRVNRLRVTGPVDFTLRSAGMLD